MTTSTTTTAKKEKNSTPGNVSAGLEQQPTVYVDKEIAALEARQPGLEAELARLEAGIVEAEGLDGQLVQVDLGQLLISAGSGANSQNPNEAATDPQLLARLKELLGDSPIFEEVVRSFESEDELKSEMVAAGVLPAAAANLGLPQKARLANHKATKKVAANPTVAKYLNSPWWMLGIGVLLLFLWGGGPFLFAITGGAIGGTRPKTNTTPSLTAAATEGTTKTVKAQTRSGATATPAPRTPRPQTQQERPVGQASSNDDSDNDQQQNQSGSRVVYLNYMVDPPLTSTATTIITATATPAPPASQSQPQTQSQPTTTAVATIPAIPTPGSGVEDAGSGDGSNNNSNYNRVGQPPTNLGGLNGPHGAFLAPSRLLAPAQGLDVLVQKAIVTENQVIISPTTQTLEAESGAVRATTTSTATISSSVSPTIAIKTSIVWPRPGEVLHYGAYPGEIGNCLILGTQGSMAALRHLEQNDEIRLYDRKNNLFVYRVVAFSPTGQPEREINPASSQDSWIFDTLTPGQALLTIIVNEPLPLPPIDPNATVAAGTGIGNTSPTSVGRDDWANPKKLAYRAVLVGFAPNTGKSATSANPVTTPVAVPSQVWQVQPAPLPRHIVLDEDNTTAAPVTPATATNPIPAGSRSGETSIDWLAVLRQLAVQINKTGSYQGNSTMTTTANPAAQTPHFQTDQDRDQNGKGVITTTAKS